MANASDRRVGNEDQFGLEPDAQVGKWYDVMSTWLSRVKFSWTRHAGGPPTIPTSDPQQRRGYLMVEFLDGAVIEYNNAQPYSVFDDLVGSSSKGYFVHYSSANLMHQAYTLISPATRKVTAEMRRLREPKKGGKGQRLIGAKRQPPALPRR